MKNAKKINWSLWRRRIALPVAMVVVFVTTYSLILPAITMERETFCGQTEHTHTDECYTVETVYTCGLEEGEEHTHTEECISETRTLTCGLEEHVHTEECFVDPNAPAEEEADAADDADAAVAAEEDAAAAEDVPAADAESEEDVPSADAEDETPEDANASEDVSDAEAADAVAEDAPENAADADATAEVAEAEDAVPSEDGESAPEEDAAEAGSSFFDVTVPNETVAEEVAPVPADVTFEQELNPEDSDRKVTVIVDCTAAAGIPADAVLEVKEYIDTDKEYDGFFDAAEGELCKNGEEIFNARFFDFTIRDAAGNELALQAPVKVKVVSDALTDQVVRAVSLDAEKPAEVELTAKDNTVRFDADGFTTFAIAFMKDDEIPAAEDEELPAEEDEELLAEEDEELPAEEEELPAKEEEDEEPAVVPVPDFEMSETEFMEEGEVFFMVEDEPEEEPIVGADVTLKKVLVSDGQTVTITVDCKAEAGIPADAQLQVREIKQTEEAYDGYLDEAKDAIDLEKKQITFVRFFDITILDAKGNEIQPKAAVDVKIVMSDAAKVDEENAPQVLHYGDENTEIVDSVTEGDAVSFEANGFSVYGIVGTETLETTLTTTDGETYTITVNYTKEAEIPNGSELVVREILPGTPEYEEDRAQTQEALGTSDLPVAEIADDEEAVVDELEDTADSVTYQVVGNAQSQLTFFRLFDISIMNGEEEIEPKVPVEVIITYVEPMATDGSSLDVVHFTDDGVEVMDEVTVSEDGTEITYQAESFSKYGTAQSSVGAGDYIIYRDNTGWGSTDYALNYQNNGNLGGQSVTVNNNSVYSTNDNVVWTFTAVTGGYRISFTDTNGTRHYLRAEIPNNNNRGTLSTTTNANDATTVWTYTDNQLRATSGTRTRYLEQNGTGFRLSTSSTSGSTIYLAKIAAPATITIHYVNESGEDIMAAQTLPDSTSSGQTAITDIVQTAAGYTYHDTYIANGDNIRATHIVPELRGAGGGTWEYQTYGHSTYTQFSGDTDIYVVYGNSYPSGGGSGNGGDGGDLNIDAPSAGKLVTPNTDGTFTLSLSITGEKDTGSESHGANVILVLDTSTSMGYPKNPYVTYKGRQMSRMDAAKLIAQEFSTQLLGMNTEEEEDLVEMALITFNGSASDPDGWYTEADGFNSKVGSATLGSGTNWEEALQKASSAASNHNDGDDTYIIFVTDGNPSWSSEYEYGPEATTATGGNYYREHAGYMNSTDEVRSIVQNGYILYTVGMFGNIDVLEKLTNFAYTGRSDGNETQRDHYYQATDASTLEERLNDIAEVISNSLAVAGVDFKDGIATDVTHTALSTNVGSGTLGGVTYRKSGGETASYTVTTDSSGNATFNFSGTTVPGSTTTISYKKIVDVEGGDPVEQDATAQVYTATYNGTTYYMPIATVSSGGDFEWDVSPLGTLENNATYTVSFVVWPDQDAYDYVTNLNNGITGYTWDSENEVPVYQPNGTTVAYYTDGVSQYPNIVKFPNGTFAAMSNTYQTVDYYVAKTEEEGGETTTTYEKGDPIALDIPDPMVLTGSNFTVTKRWDDSLDQSQLAELIANAENQGHTYSVTLNLKEDGEFYKAYTFKPVWNEETEKYEWPSQTINIAPGLLTSTNPGGTYKTVTIGGTTYYVLNEGHEYVLEETDLDSHFEFVTETYHPALVNGVLMNVSFEVNDSNEIVNGSTATIVGDVPLSTFMGVNTLKGGINIYKRVVDEEGTIVDDDSTFKVQVALDHINQEGTQIWFDTYEVDPSTGEIVIPTEDQLTHWINTTTGEVTETEPSGYKDKVQVIDAEKGIYKNADGVLYGVNGKTLVYDDETNYIGSGGYGNVSGYTNVLDIQDNWMIRIVNVLAGTTYEVTETQTNGMQPSYAYWHDNAESDEHIVIGNAASNIRITNKIVNRKVIIYKTDITDTDAGPLEGASFTINGETLTTGENGYTAVIELPVSDTPYDLAETVAPNGYNKLENPVKVTVSSSSVTFIQSGYDGGNAQTATKDSNGNYVVIVRDNPGVELPHTGGTGTFTYTLSGLMLLIASAIMYGFRMRRRERRLTR